jgi:hypothetical protein
MISGFMITKNVLEQGYPFVEAIASALSICDEFLISDGYSTDGTFEVLQRISRLNPKVKVYQYHWPEKKDMTVLADVTNEVRSKCRFEHIFSIQANEIVHEQSAPFIKALPSMLPQVETFTLPFIFLLNENKFAEEYRLRLCKNLPSIVSIGDAWTMGASKTFLRTKKLKALANPRRLSGYLDKGISFVYANVQLDPYSRPIYLPKPVFRYWALFPKDFLAKYERHVKSFQPITKPIDEQLRMHVGEPEVFWKLGSEALKERKFMEVLQYPKGYNSVVREEHPAIIQEFIDNPSVDKYYIREELFTQFPNL